MKNKKLLRYLGFLLLVPSLFLNFFLFASWRQEKNKDLRLVVDVFDGDTFYLDNQEKVRLLNANAPELGFCGSKEAKKRLEELILNKKVRIEPLTIDHYGRKVALVYQGKRLVNKTMLLEGWAVFEGKKTKEFPNFSPLAKEVREKGLGIYSPKCYQKENLEKPQCNIKGNISRGKREKIYHLPGCSGYNRIIIEKFKGEQWFCSESEAEKAGFKKSRQCR